MALNQMNPKAAPEVEDPELDDEESDEEEQFGIPESLLQAAGIMSDEDWDALEPIDLDALARRNASRQ